jgi:peptidoglycan/xylan/chitin deacetylase (PgdA/CDA1 family)
MRLTPGPAWPIEIPWPAGDQNAPGLTLEHFTVTETSDIAVFGTAGSGDVVPLVGRTTNGFVATFDTEAWLRMLKSESYRSEHVLPLSARLPFHYHRLPGFVRNALASLLLRLSKPRTEGFPTHLNDCGPLLLTGLLEERPSTHVAVLTHDIDTALALAWIDGIAEAEEAVGARSCWNVVPRHYEIDHSQLGRLAERGHEIGLHGIWHTNQEAFLGDALAREFDALGELRQRYAMRTYRGPSWYRTQSMYDVLEDYFDIDLSALDTDLLCPGGPGGVGLAQPFHIRPRLVELPCTVPFEAPLLVGPRPAHIVEFWKPKIRLLKQLGGIVVVNTHPDPNYLGNPVMLAAYKALLDLLARDGWTFRLPREIAANLREGDVFSGSRGQL